LREKKVSRIFFWVIGVLKKITNFQKILKKYFTGELQKKVQGTKRGAANHSFFTHPVCKYTGLSSSVLPNVNRA